MFLKMNFFTRLFQINTLTTKPLIALAGLVAKDSSWATRIPLALSLVFKNEFNWNRKLLLSLLSSL